ncbi:MAG: hypothetical protein KatS3mg027_0740 [Bacteroidia bacterium]|nr:MAG: hypothetical protein KatS3mg027_0740 [Bacteroidia bacterium]
MIDNSSNVFAFAISSNFPGTPVRTQITTSYQLLAHVKMGIVNCGNVNVTLTNSVTAINSCFYTTSSTGTTLNSYNSLTYNGYLTNSISVCPPTIKDFNSPINGGLNEILTIKGNNFGATRGSGQVKFRNADKLGFPYLNKLDNIDYLSWNDTMIQIRMPSTIDTINPSLTNTPGSGNFIVITNSGDSVISNLNLASKSFSVYFSIYNTIVKSGLPTIQKLKANLYKSNALTGGYVIRLDTSVGNNPNMVMCVKKAIKDWTCLTGVNIKLGTDTALQGFGVMDTICNIFVAEPSQFSNPNIIAETRVNANIICPSPPTRMLVDFDIRINKSYLNKFFYDTLFNTLPAFNVDFLEVMYHEIGHGIGLMHVIDSTAVMYYRTLGNQPFSIPGSLRRKLQPYTSDVDGGDYQVSTSDLNIYGQCGFYDMIQLTSGSCVVIGIEEFLKLKYNIKVYPNPASDLLNINFENPSNSKYQIEMYNLLGGKFFLKNIVTNNNDQIQATLNLEEYTSGIYILGIIIDGIKIPFKIVKL